MAEINLVKITDLDPFASVNNDVVFPGARLSNDDTGYNTITQLKAYVLDAPVITGMASVPTPNLGANNTQPANTQWVRTELTGIGLSPATSTTSGTVRTNTTDAVPVVYLKSEVDTALNALKVSGGVALGGTGATTPSAARSNLVAAVSGSNNDITNLTALTDVPSYIGGFMDMMNPIGSIIAYPALDAADTNSVALKTYLGKMGYLECDGTSYTTAGYPALHDVIRYKFGGSGANFNVPDLRGRVVLGAGVSAASGTNRAIATTGGADSHTLSTSELPSHGHSLPGISRTASVTGNASGFEFGDPTGGTGAISSGNNGSGAAHNNLQPFMALRYFIRAEAWSVVYARVKTPYGKFPTFSEYRTSPI